MKNQWYNFKGLDYFEAMDFALEIEDDIFDNVTEVFAVVVEKKDEYGNIISSVVHIVENFLECNNIININEYNKNIDVRVYYVTCIEICQLYYKFSSNEYSRKSLSTAKKYHRRDFVQRLIDNETLIIWYRK